jgi:TPR repeat protein
MYYIGEGVEQNYQEVFKWYMKSAEQDNDDAQ